MSAGEYISLYMWREQRSISWAWLGERCLHRPAGSASAANKPRTMASRRMEAQLLLIYCHKKKHIMQESINETDMFYCPRCSPLLLRGKPQMLEAVMQKSSQWFVLSDCQISCCSSIALPVPPSSLRLSSPPSS